MAQAKDIRPGDLVLIKDIGCWARVGSVDSFEDKAIIALSDGPPGTVGMILPNETELTARRQRNPPDFDPDTLSGVVAEMRHQCQQSTPGHSNQ